MLSEDTIRRITKYLEDITQRRARLTSSKEIESVCPFCLGSPSNPRKRQFYINTIEPPYLYHCFRCGESGTLAKLIINFFDTQQVDKSALLSIIGKQKSNSLQITSNNFIDLATLNRLIEVLGNRRLKTVEDLLSNDVFCTQCRNYIIKRTFSLEEIRQLADVYNNAVSNLFSSFLCCRHLSYILQEDCSGNIGILTKNKTLLQLRNYLNTEYKYKLVKVVYMVHDNRAFKVMKDFPLFVLTTKEKNKPVALLIAEGIFSLYGGFFKLFKSMRLAKYSTIYGTCSLGKELFTQNFEWLTKFVFIYDTIDNRTDVYVLCDSDVPIDFFRSKKMNFALANMLLRKATFLYPPKKHKDFGEYFEVSNIIVRKLWHK